MLEVLLQLGRHHSSATLLYHAGHTRAPPVVGSSAASACWLAAVLVTIYDHVTSPVAAVSSSRSRHFPTGCVTG